MSGDAAQRRVVLTGLGPISGFGVGTKPMWDAMLEGRSAIKRISAFDPSGFKCQVAAELDPGAFKVNKIVPRSYRKAVKVMCRDVELAVGAADAAIADAGLVTKANDGDDPPTIPPERFGCQIGAGLISAEVNELTEAMVTSQNPDGTIDLATWGETGMTHLTPLWMLKYLPNMLACHVTIIHECRGPSNTITCCEASSLLSIGESLRVIQRDHAEACLSGGAEYKLNPIAFTRQHFAGRLAEAGADVEPATVVKPFDENASGTVLGEGGGLLVVEALDSAERRGANQYAEIVSFAATQSIGRDACALELEPDDPSVVDVMEIALDNANLKPSDIDAIVPFGSGIPSSDAAESHAIRRVFGDAAFDIPIVTTVPFTGNCNAGNGAISVAVAAKCLKEQKLPARLNSTRTNGINATATGSRDAELRHVLVTTTSQGGQNAALILRAMN